MPEQEKKKGKPRRALKSRGKYEAYRRRKGGIGHREHHRHSKPSGVLVGRPSGLQAWIPTDAAINGIRKTT